MSGRQLSTVVACAYGVGGAAAALLWCLMFGPALAVLIAYLAGSHP